ncbi:MAG: CDP-alcohol phosphatidyltransferase family protein [Planctomycetota bacterium]
MSVVATFPPSVSGKPRRKRLKSLAFLPTLLTLGNLTCGFAAVHFALRAMYELGAGISDGQILTMKSVQIERLLPSAIQVGAGLIIVGMIFDCFDGLIARMTHSMTNFGAQLDSLADVVTCGLAPATLIVAFMTKELAAESVLPSPISEHFLGRISWVSAAVYLACAALRLARYNVEHDRKDFDYRLFRGLPSPGAASLIVAIILIHEQVGPFAGGLMVYALPAAALATGFLMVSRIPYRRFYRAYLVGRQPFTHLVGFVGMATIFSVAKAPTLLALVLWYWVSGPVEWAYRALRGRSTPNANPGAANASGDTATDRRLA